MVSLNFGYNCGTKASSRESRDEVMRTSTENELQPGPSLPTAGGCNVAKPDILVILGIFDLSSSDYHCNGKVICNISAEII